MVAKDTVTINAAAVENKRRHATYEAPVESESLGLLQAAFYLKMHPSYIRTLVTNGSIPGTKDEKNHWTVQKADLDAYLAEKSVGAERTPGEKTAAGYVPANVAGCRRVIKLITDMELDENDKAIALDVVNRLLADAVAGWEATKALKAKVSDTETDTTEENLNMPEPKTSGQFDASKPRGEAY